MHSLTRVRNSLFATGGGQADTVVFDHQQVFIEAADRLFVVFLAGASSKSFGQAFISYRRRRQLEALNVVRSVRP